MEFKALTNGDSLGTVRNALMYLLKINKDESGILAETLRFDWQRIYSTGREFEIQYCSITPSGIARDENV